MNVMLGSPENTRAPLWTQNNKSNGEGLVTNCELVKMTRGMPRSVPNNYEGPALVAITSRGSPSPLPKERARRGGSLRARVYTSIGMGFFTVPIASRSTY
ncbi:hypothetical protein ABIB81_009198 [Bradyrhizobium sp. I1.7.5]